MTEFSPKTNHSLETFYSWVTCPLPLDGQRRVYLDANAAQVSQMTATVSETTLHAIMPEKRV